MRRSRRKPTREPTQRRSIDSGGVRLRLVAAMLALAAGIAALVVAIQLVRSVLG